MPGLFMYLSLNLLNHSRSFIRENDNFTFEPLYARPTRRFLPRNTVEPLSTARRCECNVCDMH